MARSLESKAGVAAGKTFEEIGGVELCERAFYLLVAAPVRAWCVYLLGLCPFGLVLLYFLTDMTVSPFAGEHLATFSFAVALAVLWWRAWQARFAAELFAVLSRRPLPAGSALDWLFLGLRQIAVFAVFLVVGAIAALVVVPMGWVLGFGQSASVIGGVGGASLRQTFKEAAAEVFVWQRQNHVALLVLSAWAFFVFLNGYMLVFMVPKLLKIATGVETVVTQSPWWVVLLNSTVFVVVCFAVYAVVSPLAKAVYVLRHYYLRSRRSGLDIRDRLARLAEQSGRRGLALRLFGGALFAGMLFSLATPLGRTQEAVTSEEIGEAIREVVQRPEFTWRMPAAASEEGVSLFRRWLWKVNRWAENFLEWIFGSWDRGGDSSGGWLGSFSPSVKHLLIVLLAAVGLLLVWLLCRLVLRRQKSSAVPGSAPQVFVKPEVDDWTALANDLPEDEWLARARRFAEEGDYRRALRAFYLSALSHLHGKQLIRITRAKSNAAYLSEVKRREHQVPGVEEAFSFVVKGFDRVWYGRYEVDEARLRAYEDHVSQIRRAAG